jgi:hypothetical protein
LLLPGTVALYANTHASKDHLLAASEIDTELYDVAILDSIEPRHHIWLAQPHVIQEGPRRAPHILDMPLPVYIEELAMLPTHNF